MKEIVIKNEKTNELTEELQREKQQDAFLDIRKNMWKKRREVA